MAWDLYRATETRNEIFYTMSSEEWLVSSPSPSTSNTSPHRLSYSTVVKWWLSKQQLVEHSFCVSIATNTSKTNMTIVRLVVWSNVAIGVMLCLNQLYNGIRWSLSHQGWLPAGKHEDLRYFPAHKVWGKFIGSGVLQNFFVIGQHQSLLYDTRIFYCFWFLFRRSLEQKLLSTLETTQSS